MEEEDKDFHMNCFRYRKHIVAALRKSSRKMVEVSNSNKKFKTRDELEDEDHVRYREHQEETFRRRIEKRMAEGYKCPYQECSMIFSQPWELTEHKEEHKKEFFENMRCSQPTCGMQVSSLLSQIVKGKSKSKSRQVSVVVRV